MRQYLDIKSKYQDAILFFRLGDFYEMFYEDAVYAARVLSLTLTTRDKGKEDPVPMAGIPHHSARTYIAKLTELGHRVALCEQLEDPKLVKPLPFRLGYGYWRRPSSMLLATKITRVSQR